MDIWIEYSKLTIAAPVSSNLIADHECDKDHQIKKIVFLFNSVRKEKVSINQCVLLNQKENENLQFYWESYTSWKLNECAIKHIKYHLTISCIYIFLSFHSLCSTSVQWEFWYLFWTFPSVLFTHSSHHRKKIFCVFLSIILFFTENHEFSFSLLTIFSLDFVFSCIVHRIFMQTCTTLHDILCESKKICFFFFKLINRHFDLNYW